MYPTDKFRTSATWPKENRPSLGYRKVRSLSNFSSFKSWLCYMTWGEAVLGQLILGRAHSMCMCPESHERCLRAWEEELGLARTPQTQGWVGEVAHPLWVCSFSDRLQEAVQFPEAPPNIPVRINCLSTICASSAFCSCLNQSLLPSTQWISILGRHPFLPPLDWSSLRADTASFVTISPFNHRVVYTEGTQRIFAALNQI